MSFNTSTVSIGKSTKKSDYDRLLDNTKALKDEAITFGSVKTFTSKPKMDGILTRSATGSVSLECQYLSSAGNSVVSLKTKIIEIGDWNMDTDVSVTITHGLIQENIRSVSGMIRGDLGVGSFIPIDGVDAGTSNAWGGYGGILATNIILTRLTGGPFDDTDFDSTSYNRGWITIQYEG